jgi:hypothetical protein
MFVTVPKMMALEASAEWSLTLADSKQRASMADRLVPSGTLNEVQLDLREAEFCALAMQSSRGCRLRLRVAAGPPSVPC